VLSSSRQVGLAFEIVKITEDNAGILSKMMSMYLAEMTAYADFLKPGEDGQYEYQHLNYYWEKKGLSAYFIKIDSEIAGFILSNEKPYLPDDCDISIREFFIKKDYRGNGYGRRAAQEFFRLFPGRYFVAQLIRNKPAIEFWHSVYERLGIRYDEREEIESGVRILTQRFIV